MDLLFRREQTTGKAGRIKFKLWGKLEPDENEQAIISRYQFDEAILIGGDDEELLRKAIKRGVIVGVVVTILALVTGPLAILIGPAAGIFAGYSFMNEQRETIFVKDLLHGRHFKCESVIDLAKKEAWLEGACGMFRQVMENAKHWDGDERHEIKPLPKEEAKDLILKAF